MPPVFRYHIRQHTAYRTRVTFPCLRRQPETCEHVRRGLAGLAEVEDVQVRPCSGSVILVHPQKPVRFATLLEQIRPLLGATPSILHQNNPAAKDALAASDHEEPSGHVSGMVLLLSGGYLLYLYIKRIFGLVAVKVGPARMLTLPAAVAFALSLPVQRQAIDTFRRSGKPDMGIISTGILYFSLFAGNTLAPLTVFWLFNLSSWLEDSIRIRTRHAVREMLSGTCQQAWLLREGLEIEVDAATLQAEDVIVLRKGNVIPADGTVLSGRALIDQGTLTGEDDPLLHGAGDTVLAGTVMVEGSLQVCVERAGEDTRLAAIIRLIEHAEHDPGELQLISQRFSQTMVPISLGLAALALLLTGNLMQAMAVLIITCPCALRLSTSVAVSAAMSTAARQGILIKGGRYVEIAGQVNVLAIDKTGTLTDRSAEVVGVIVYDRRYREDTILRLAASAQQAWSHPLSRALVERAKSKRISLLAAIEPELVVGQGVCACIGGQTILVGNDTLFTERGVVTDQLTDRGSPGKGELLVACDGRLLGAIQVRHRKRPGSQDALVRLRTLGIEPIVLLTGDNRVEIGETYEREFDHVLCCQSPEAKASWIASWKRHHPGAVIAMVGDGINDTPAFAAADLSLAIGQGGADVTVEYADIVLQRGGVDQVVDTLVLGRRTLRTISACYALALSLNGCILALTTLGFLSPVGGGFVA